MTPNDAVPAPATDPVEQRLEKYFDLLGTQLWDCRQRHNFATYAIGLMSELERKSIEPIASSFTNDPKEAERLQDRLQNVVADAPWPDHAVRRLATHYALSAMLKRGPIEVSVCDDTSFLKSGDHSVGVQPQYLGCVGKVANGQVAPSLVVATKYTHLPIDMTLYLGKKWANTPKRRKEAKIPPQVQFETKPQLMLKLLQNAHQDGIPLGVVLGDSAFGTSAEFRAGVRALPKHYLLGVQLSTGVCLQKKGVSAAPQRIQQIIKQLPPKAYRRYRWRDGSRGKKLSARFAFLQVRVPDDPTGELLWLILEWRDEDKEPCRAHLSSLPPSTSRRTLVYRLKERYRTEQMYREAKQEVGLDQYEGRGWLGFMHHVTVVLCCYAFLVAEREGVFPPWGTQRRGRPPARPIQSPQADPHPGAPPAVGGRPFP
jgi:SRSO17 transposase